MRCENMRRGCHWTGTIGTLDNHIATCQIPLVPCPNKCEDNKGAGELHLMRKDLDDHLKTKCPKRDYKCQHCGEKGTYASITEDHDKVCNKKIVSCPNKGSGCRLSMERGKTNQHVMSVCDYTEVACAYESLGCGVRMLRKDAVKHEKDSRERHLDLSLVSIRSIKRISLNDNESIIYKVTDFETTKRANSFNKSHPFYISPQGYEMKITVYANGYGSGEGTHVSVYTGLLQGSYDASLSWPFVGSVTLTLMNQLADENHHSMTIEHEVQNNVQVGEGLGYQQFISHSELSHNPVKNTQYLKNNTLYFQVTVKVDDHKPWLVGKHYI